MKVLSGLVGRLQILTTLSTLSTLFNSSPIYAFGVRNMATNSQFTAKDMLEAPRRSSAVPNGDGTLAIFSSKSYSFKHHKYTKEWNLLNTKTGETSLIPGVNEASEIVWVGGKTTDLLAYLKGSNEPVKGSTELWIANVENVEETAHKVASFPAEVSNLVFQSNPQSTDSINFVVSALAEPSGKIYNKELAPKKYDTGRVYTNLYARHWDSWIEKEKSAIFAGTLSKPPSSISEEIQKVMNVKTSQIYTADSNLWNLIQDSKLESPIAPFGDSGDFSISPDGKTVAFLSKAPELNPATNTAVYLYLVSHSESEWKAPKPINKPSDTHKHEGATASPNFSPDGRSIVFLQMKENGYESDKNEVFIYDVESGNITQVLKGWDRSPDSVFWSPKGDFLYLTAADHARGKLWKTAPISEITGPSEPTALTSKHSISKAYPLPDGSGILLSQTKLTSPTFYTLFNTFSHTLHTLNSPKVHNAPHNNVLEELYIPGSAPNTTVHSLILKPSNFDPTKTYPLAFFIHGGPQGAWSDGWSTRWNPLVFSEAGYISVLVNPTGSTSYGQSFTDAIALNWGGAPYDDLVLTFSHLRDHLPYIDTTRAVALGASYGGYMINWIQGHPLGREFRALVCHDGIFNTQNMLATEELYFNAHDFGGHLWDNPETYERWNPARPEFLREWNTPQLVIHNPKDYRLVIGEGLSTFNRLQLAGVESKLVVFEGENHWVLQPENSLRWHGEVLGWVNKFVGLPTDVVGREGWTPEGEEEGEGGKVVVVSGGEETEVREDL